MQNTTWNLRTLSNFVGTCEKSADNISDLQLFDVFGHRLYMNWFIEHLHLHSRSCLASLLPPLLFYPSIVSALWGSSGTG